MTVTGPTMKDIFLTQKGQIMCEAKANVPAISRVIWEDEAGNELSEAEQVNKDTFRGSLDISYDEWSRGVKRFCVVHHSNLMEPVKKPYERTVGKKTFQHFCSENHFILFIIIHFYAFKI